MGRMENGFETRLFFSGRGAAGPSEERTERTAETGPRRRGVRGGGRGAGGGVPGLLSRGTTKRRGKTRNLKRVEPLKVLKFEIGISSLRPQGEGTTEHTEYTEEI